MEKKGMRKDEIWGIWGAGPMHDQLYPFYSCAHHPTLSATTKFLGLSPLSFWDH